MPRPERLLELDGTGLPEFAADLRQLRQKAGSPPYRKLALRAHYSATTLSDAASGRQLPTLGVTLAYVRACDGDVDEWERRWRALAAELNATRLKESGDDGAPAPYLGLSAYGPADTDRFFGRERLVDELVARVGAERFLAVFGASGSGKSSLLRAGLLPRLGAQRTVLFTPGPNPVEECAVQLANLTGRPASTVRDELSVAPRNLHLIVRQALVDRPDDVVLVVDQFEEVFTLCRDEDQRSAFISALVAAAGADTSRCRVVLGVRADFYAHCSRYGELVGALQDRQLVVGALGSDELRRAIVSPATQAGCTVETSLLTTLVAYGHDRPGVLPLLSHALLETWRRRRGNTLTLDGFRAIGGVDGALANTAEQVFETLTTEQRRACRDLFLRMTALGEGTEDTKRRVEPRDLDGEPHAAVVVERLVASRLIVVTEDGIEVAHEALIRAWPRLAGWLAADRDGQRVHRELTEAAALWEQHGRDPGALLRGTRLALTREWKQRTATVLNSREQALFDASVTAERRDRTTARRRNRILVGLVVMLAVISVVATFVAVKAMEWQRAADHERDSALAVNVVRESGRIVGVDPQLAASLSLAAYRLDASAATRESLIANTAAATAEDWPSLIPGPPVDSAFSFSAAGHLGASSDTSTDTAHLWELAAGDRAELLGALSGGARPATLSADGRTAATVDRHATIRVWDSADSRRPVEQAVLPAPGVPASFSGDGRLLVTYDVTGPRATGKWAPTMSARMWDVTDLRRPRDLGSLAGQNVRFVSAPGSRTLVSLGRTEDSGVTRGNEVRFWGTEGSRLAATFETGDRQIDTAALTTGARFLVTGGATGSLAVWDVENPGDRRFVERIDGAHVGGVTGMVTSRDGRLLATSGRTDAKVIVWRISKRGTLTKFLEFASTSGFPGLSFSEDSQTLLGHAELPRADVIPQGTIRRWHLDPGRAENIVCGPEFPGISRPTWARYFPSVPYHSPCDRS